MRVLSVFWVVFPIFTHVLAASEQIPYEGRENVVHCLDTCMNNLGSLYEEGRGVNVNIEKAIHFYKEASSYGGHEVARENLQHFQVEEN